jgi:hypothetical protein
MKTWFTKMRTAMSVKGLPFVGVIHKFNPIIKGKAVATVACPKCEYKTATLWLSTSDPEVFASLCPRCKKFEVRRKGQAKQKMSSEHHATCGCGQPLPEGRTMFCYDCRPKTVKPKAITNADGSGSIQGQVTGFGF